MFNKRFGSIFFSAFATLFLLAALPQESFSKGYRSSSFGGSYSRSSSVSKSYRSYSSSSRTTKTARPSSRYQSTATKSDGSYKNKTPGMQTASAAKPIKSVQKKPAKPKITPKYVKSLDKKQSGQLLAKVQTKKAKVSPVAVKKSPSYVSAPRISSSDYRVRRDRYYESSGWTRPHYVYASPYRTYGMWDSDWMWYAVTNAAMYSWFFHHQSDPGVAAWRAEADRLAKDNADLKAQLASLDNSLSSSQYKNTKPDPAFVPKDVDQAAMISSEVATRVDVSEFKMATGGVDSPYFETCKKIQNNDTGVLNVNCGASKGSLDNLDAFESGKVHAALVQADVFDGWSRSNKVALDAYQSAAYDEVVFLLVNEGSDVDSIDDINPSKHNIYAVGSGSVQTIKSFAKRESDYAPLAKNIIQLSPSKESIDKVASDKSAVMFYVCGMNCGLIQYANDTHGDSMEMASIEDWDLDDRDIYGNAIYKEVIVPEVYSNLQNSAWFGESSTPTIGVEAVFLMSKDWAKEKGVNINELNAIFIPSFKEMRSEVGEANG